jgi:glycosyltransferase involved in cell wall biosynthesis
VLLQSALHAKVRSTLISGCVSKELQPNHPPIKLTFLVRSLDYGGAQRQLIALARALDKDRFSISVLTFYHGQLEQELEHDDVRVICLEKRGRWDIIGFLRRLVHQVKVIQPDVLHGYLDIPNLLALFLRRFVDARVVWGLRSSAIEVDQYDWLHRLASRLEQSFAGRADLIIINSRAGLEHHVARGFPHERMTVVPNGFDSARFGPDPVAGEQRRRDWGISKSTKLVGIVGRLDLMKDHENFLRAAAQVAQTAPEVRFVCAGDGPANRLAKLKSLAIELGISDQMIWQAATTDVAAVYNALDILVSTSRGEGFPNVVGEAMACGVPCVVTDVGDSRWLVGEAGVVVAPGDEKSLAEGIVQSLAFDRVAVGRQSRARIVENFSLQTLAHRTAEAITLSVNAASKSTR